MYDCPNEEPGIVEFDINHPRMAERYYSRNLNIGEINRTRQDDLQLERKLQTKYWSIKINTSILGMDYCDNCYLGKAFEWWDDRNPSDLYYNITEEIIDNWWTEITTGRNQAGLPT